MSTNKIEEMKQTALKHLKDPQAGDYWHEMFCPIMIVMEYVPEMNAVYLIDSRGRDMVNSNKDVVLVDMDEFLKVNTYHNVTGELQGQPCSDVVPGKYRKMVDDWLLCKRPYEDRRKCVINKSGVYEVIIPGSVWFVNDEEAVYAITGMGPKGSVETPEPITYPAALVKSPEGEYVVHKDLSFINKMFDTFKKEHNSPVWRKR